MFGGLTATLKVWKASDAISKFWTSVFVISLKTRSLCSAILQHDPCITSTRKKKSKKYLAQAVVHAVRVMSALCDALAAYAVP